MPSRNTVKQFDTDAYYHVYNRGVEKRQIFLDDEDYAAFANLCKRHVGPEPTFDNRGREYQWLGDQIEVVAFCLMPNHFHMLVYQSELDAMTAMMRAVCSSYTTYFNSKYDRVGSLFQGIYKASRITREEYLAHITRYIHLNPVDYDTWRWSSVGVYLGRHTIDWIHPERVMDLTPAGCHRYRGFLEDYVDYRAHLENIESFLAC